MEGSASVERAMDHPFGLSGAPGKTHSISASSVRLFRGNIKVKIIPIHHEPMKSEFNSIFSANFPLRSVILVAGLVHIDLMIEIDGIAAAPKS